MEIIKIYLKLLWKPQTAINQIREKSWEKPSIILGTLFCWATAFPFLLGTINIFFARTSVFVELILAIVAIPLAYLLFKIFNFFFTAVIRVITGEKYEDLEVMKYSGLFLLPKVIVGVGSVIVLSLVLIILGISTNSFQMIDLDKNKVFSIFFLILVLIYLIWKFLYQVSLIKSSFALKGGRAFIAYLLIIIVMAMGSSLVENNLIGSFSSNYHNLSARAVEVNQTDNLTFGSDYARFPYWIRDPKLDELVVFDKGEDVGQEVARIVALPGDKVEIKGGRVYLNGQEKEEPYLDTENKSLKWGPERLTEGQYLLLPDNRQMNKVYLVEEKEVKGKVLQPMNRFIHLLINATN